MLINYIGCRSSCSKQYNLIQSTSLCIVEEGNPLQNCAYSQFLKFDHEGLDSSAIVFRPNGLKGDIYGYRIHKTDGKPILKLQEHFSKVNSIIYRSSNQELVSSSADGLIFVWSPETTINQKTGDQNEQEVFDNDWSDDEEIDNNSEYIPPLLR